MPDGMANNANGNVAAAAAAAAAANNGQRRDPSPELRQRGCWGKFFCINPSRKRGMRIAPARSEGNGNSSTAWATNGASSSTAANQYNGISPSLLAPPSSPASFANSGNPSTAQSPASFTVSFSAPTAVVCSPAFDSTATMFTIGPYAHETTLVTPPAFSAFTTAPSTAPFTPPPELAHFTTPSSPDVPYACAQLLWAKGGGSSGPQPAAPYSASPFASPDYISRSGDMQSTYQMYPESPLASLISPASGISESGPPSPLPELEFPAAVMANKSSALSVRRFRPSTSFSGLELPSKPSENSSIGGSANHSRELEPIRILSPGYHPDRRTTTYVPASSGGCSPRDGVQQPENHPETPLSVNGEAEVPSTPRSEEPEEAEVRISDPSSTLVNEDATAEASEDSQVEACSSRIDNPRAGNFFQDEKSELEDRPAQPECASKSELEDRSEDRAAAMSDLEDRSEVSAATELEDRAAAAMSEVEDQAAGKPESEGRGEEFGDCGDCLRDEDHLHQQQQQQDVSNGHFSPWSKLKVPGELVDCKAET